jgi:uncharacterized LabA/DUF88 family protein
MKEVIIFIDSGYLYYISKYLGKGKPLKYKIEEFASRLAKQRGLTCKKIYFYLAPQFQSPSPNQEENKRKANYDKFIEKLKQIELPIVIREGRCQKIDNTFQQKGVDTLMTMDLLKASQKREASAIILLTSDTDFVPIIEEIRKDFGIKVILAYFTDKKRKSPFSLSNHLWRVCDEYILIKREHFGG